jgi:predicted HicB family RNase H-like nuclease
MPQPKPKKIGRPKLPKGEAKGRVLQVRLNAEDLKRVTTAAKAKGQTMSDWIREAINAAA